MPVRNAGSRLEPNEGGSIMSTISAIHCPVFDRVLCAVDGSQSALEAARQARVLRSEGGTIELDAVFEPPTVSYSPYGGPQIVSEAEKEAAADLAEARSRCPEATAHLLHGATIRRLLERITESDASLVAVGAPGRHRGVGIIRGSVATALLHVAPCSVLVARSPGDPGSFPRSIVVGFDGSPAAERALDAAHDIRDRHGSALRVIVAGPSCEIAPRLLDEMLAERDQRDPLEALLAASRAADLVVVGSRELRGLQALGSLSERLGHQAACSVLVVR
jgi:nucleotide-binding universal stress UspA family protein